MSTFEAFESGRILVARQLIDPALLTDLAGEGNKLVDAGTPYSLTSGAESPTLVESTFRPYGLLDSHPTITKVVDFMFGSDASATRIQANRQHALASQRFHSDPRKNPVVIVHANNRGAFDYIRMGVATNPEDTWGDDGTMTEHYPDEFETIRLEAGDVLVQRDPELLHRGRNLSDTDRITLGVYTN